MIKKLIAFLILLALAYFPGGYFAVTKNWITMTLFLSIGSGIGGLASIFSLISFIRPPLTRDDIKNLDWESVAQVAAREKEITKLEEQKSKQITELSELEKRKIEMEALAKKATMELFLKNQFEEVEKRITAHINNNSELRSDLKLHKESSLKLKQLNIEIESHPDAGLLREIVEDASHKEIDSISLAVKTAKELPVFGTVIKFIEVFVLSIFGLFELLTKSSKIEKR